MRKGPVGGVAAVLAAASRAVTATSVCNTAETTFFAAPAAAAVASRRWFSSLSSPEADAAQKPASIKGEPAAGARGASSVASPQQENPQQTHDKRKPPNLQEFSIYRWSPEEPGKPRMQTYKA